MQNAIYLDFNATTPTDPRVLNVMKSYFDIYYGNPASALHSKGWEAKAAVDKAREQVAQLIGAHPHEIAFTAGATESNNWALKGLVDFLREENPGQPLHVLTSNVEHASVREPLISLAQKGLIEVDFLPVNSEGFISLEQLEKACKPATKILSLIWVQNEIGSIQTLKTLGDWAQKKGIYLHTDATQAVGKIHVDVREIPISLMSFSGHKIYGPKGVGALYVRGHNPKVILRPLLHGGGQETLGRSGTLNVPGIVGLGEACRLAGLEKTQDFERVQKLTQNFWHELHKEFPTLKLNGPSLLERSPYNLSITFPGVKGFELLPLISSLCVSAGSACSSGNLQGSPTLLAIGHEPQDESVTLRFSAGRSSTQEDFSGAFHILSNSLKKLGFSRAQEGSQSLTPVLE